MWTKRLITGLVIGCLGTATGFAVSQFSDKKANAAVMVYDAENIMEAAKTAINTANILTEEQKELALQIIDMSSMTTEQLANYLQKHSNNQDEIWNENENKNGALKQSNSVSKFWQDNFNNVEAVLNGNMTVVDAYEANQKALNALEKTQFDAIHNAKATQNAANEMGVMVNDALTNSANAEGTKAAVQANTQAVAVAAMGTLHTNNLLSDMVAQQTLKYKKELDEEAASIALQQTLARNAKESVNKMKSYVDAN